MAVAEPAKSPLQILEENEQQWLYTEDELLRTPSICDGMKPEEERVLRSKGVNFITQVGIMLKLSHSTLGTAAVFFNRFLMRRSLVDKDGVKALHHYVGGLQPLALPAHLGWWLTNPSKSQQCPSSSRQK